jgi:hypothetical protein
MGILDKISEIHRKSVNEDWRETAREYNKAKEVKDFHEARQNALNYNLKTRYGDWDVKIKFENSKLLSGIAGLAADIKDRATKAAGNVVYDIDSICKRDPAAKSRAERPNGKGVTNQRADVARDAAGDAAGREAMAEDFMVVPKRGRRDAGGRE